MNRGFSRLLRSQVIPDLAWMIRLSRYGPHRTVIQTCDEQLDFKALLQVQNVQSAAAESVEIYGVTLESPTNQEFKVSAIDGLTLTRSTANSVLAPSKPVSRGNS